MTVNTGSMADGVAFSVDLEPNKDGTLDGVSEAMEWFDDVVPRGTVYTTYRIATELPDVVGRLATNHEIGVHVHPHEFGYDHDQLARLSSQQQRELIRQTRTAIVDSTKINTTDVISFRAGRHSANLTTLEVLSDLGLAIDASAHVNYGWFPESIATATEPMKLANGIFELPTSYYHPPFFSLLGLRRFDNRTITATASTLRSDSPFCSGLRAVRALFSEMDGIVSMYMHPYDATDYHSSLENGGQPFRNRIRRILTSVDHFVSACDIAHNCVYEASNHRF